jgi:hypothetical protein
MTSHVQIARRFRGPQASGNGGYSCGLLAGFVPGGEAEVTLRLPPPLERPLRIGHDGDRVLLLDGEALVAEAVPAQVDVTPPQLVGFDEAVDAKARYTGYDEHPFPECFTCGTDREPGDALLIHPGEVRPGLVAAPWVAHDVSPEVVWAAIDCPGAFGVGMAGRGETVLGRMAARIDRLPREGERCVALGFALGEDGRKLYAGTALLGEGGETLAVARQTWIQPKP